MPQEEEPVHYVDVDTDPPHLSCGLELVPGGPGALYSIEERFVSCRACLGVLKTEPPAQG